MYRGFDSHSVDPQNSAHPVSKPTQVADIGSIQQSLVEHFGDIEDPRVERTKKHQLTDILVIAILAIIAGARGWEDAGKTAMICEFLRNVPKSINSRT
jgi:hypothetical protein